MDAQRRTLLKTLTWRLIAIVLTMAVVYPYNRDFEASLYFSLFLNFIKMLFYYLHERIWNKVPFGREFDLQ